MNKFGILSVTLAGVVFATSIYEVGKSEHCDVETFVSENIYQTCVQVVTGSCNGPWTQSGMYHSQPVGWLCPYLDL